MSDPLIIPVPTPIVPNFATLSAMITPAIFMTANGSLIISTSNRMSRIVDRIRVLNDLADELGRGVSGLDFVAERRCHIDDQLLRLSWRSDRIRIALAVLYQSFACFVGTSLTLAVHSWINHTLIRAVANSLSVIGVCLMLWASINMIREVNAALSSNRREVQFHRDLHELRDGSQPEARQPCP